MRLLIALAVALGAWLVSKRAVRHVPHRMRPVALTAATLLIIAALNGVNLCAPGWCGWYGFPLHYYSWSDSMVTFNDVCLGCPGYHPLGAVTNVVFAAVLGLVVFRRERRSLREPVV